MINSKSSLKEYLFILQWNTIAAKDGALSICSQLISGAQGFIALAIVGRYLPQKEFGFIVITNAILYGGQCLLLGAITNPTLRFGAISNKSLKATYSIYVVIVIVMCSIFLFAGSKIGAIFSFNPSFDTLVRFLSVPFATVSLFSVLKIVSLARMRYGLVLLMDLLFTAGNLGVLLALLVDARLSATIFYAARTMGAVIGICPAIFVAFRLRGKSQQQIETHFRTSWYFEHSKYSLVCMASSYAQTQVDALAVGYFLDPLSVATYGAAKMFYTGMTMVTAGLARTVLPRTSKIVASGDGTAASYYRESLLLGYSILLPMSVALLLFPGFFLNLFFAGRYANAAPILRLLSLAGLLMPIGGITDAVANGTGWFRISCLSSIAGGAIGIFVSLDFTRIWGAPGAALTPLLALLGSSIVIVPVVWKKITHIGNA